MIQFIHTNKGHKPLGPYAQAVKTKGLIFCSGTAGVNPKTEKLAEGLENQTRQIFDNLKEVLLSAGSNLSHVVKVTIFLKNMNEFAKMNTVYNEIFGKKAPARTTIEVSDLPKKGALIVADLIAIEK